MFCLLRCSPSYKPVHSTLVILRPAYAHLHPASLSGLSSAAALLSANDSCLWVSESPCKQKICVKMGHKHRVGDQIICIPVTDIYTNMTKIITLNPTTSTQQYTLKINPSYLNLDHHGVHQINQTIEPLQATSTTYNPEIIQINYTPTHQRANIGDYHEILVHAIWSNGTSLNHGKININNRSYYINETGWTNIKQKQGETIQIETPYPQVYKYTSYTEPVWDQVIIELISQTPRINTGTQAPIIIHAYYQSDGEVFNGEIQYSNNLTQNQATSQIITATSITDPEYDLTSFTSNTIQQTWDHITITETGTTNPNPSPGESTIYWARAIYQYDSKPFNETTGTLYTDNNPMTWSTENNRWEHQYQQNQETTITPQITEVHDNLHGLTKIQDTTNPITIQYKSSGIPGYPLQSIILAVITIYYKQKNHKYTKNSTHANNIFPIITSYLL